MLRIGVGDFDALGVLDGEITGDGDGPGRGDDVGEELDLYSRDSIIEFLFFPQNRISYTGAYGTSFTPVGITHYAFFWVTVIESLIRTPL